MATIQAAEPLLSPLPGTAQRHWLGVAFSFYIIRLSNRFASFAIEFRPTILGKLKLKAIFYQQITIKPCE
jgi:hypothetical protein